MTTMFPPISNTGFWAGPSPIYHDICVELCDWVAEHLKDQKDRPLYDFGCGIGQYCKRLTNAGFTNVLGFEGSIPANKEFDNIRQQDLTVPFFLPEKGNCIFFEVAEHVPAQYEGTLLKNISEACDGWLVMSWALRKQGGHGHVNELNNDEAISRLENTGFIFCPEETKAARGVIPADTKLPWFLNTTMVFKKVK